MLQIEEVAWARGLYRPASELRKVGSEIWDWREQRRARLRVRIRDMKSQRP
jgi:hypothetical protein